jgi:hypothetical protein
MTRTIFIAAALALAVTLPAAPARAQAIRTFVSAAGSDSNICTNVDTPCRNFAAAYALTAPEGEIDVLNPANYGALTINQGISIQGHGWASVSAVSGGAAITINGGDKINISGVILDGGAAASSTGIQFNSGGSLNIRDSVIRNFGQYGISFVPNTSSLSQLLVSNTLVSDNGGHGININPAGSGTTTGVLDHVQIENNAGSGLHVQTRTQTINMTVSDSVSANNGNGIFAESDGGTSVSVMVRNSTLANNTTTGVVAIKPGATLRVTRSTITGNGIAGWHNYGTGGIVPSYADNNIDGNGSNNSTPGSAIPYH